LSLSIVPHAPNADLHITGTNPQHPPFGSGAMATVNFLIIRRDQNAKEGAFIPDRIRNNRFSDSIGLHLGKEKPVRIPIQTPPDEETREGL
jgi:hypothetical protein